MKTNKYIYSRNKELNNAAISYLAIFNNNRKHLKEIGFKPNHIITIRQEFIRDNYAYDREEINNYFEQGESLRSFWLRKLDYEKRNKLETQRLAKEAVERHLQFNKEMETRIEELNKTRNKIAVVDIYKPKVTLIKTIDTSRN